MASSRVDAAESSIAGVESGDGGRLRIDTRGDAHGGSASGIHRRPDTCANCSEKRGAIGGTFFRCDDFDGMTVDIRLNLTP